MVVVVSETFGIAARKSSFFVVVENRIVTKHDVNDVNDDDETRLDSARPPQSLEMILLPLVKVFASSSTSSSSKSFTSSSLEKTLFLASLLFIGSFSTTTTWTTTTAQRLSDDTPSSSFSSKSLMGEEEGDDAGRPRIPPPTTFHPPSGSYPAPVAVRVAQSEEGGASVASCEKILVTVNGEALDDKVSYANTPVVLDREGVYVVKAVCLTGTVFGKENRAEYVVLPKNDDDEGSVYSNTTKDGKRRAGGIFLGIVLIVGMLATLGVCGAAFQSFRGEFHRGAQRFVGPGVGEIRRSRLGSVGSGSAADFVNWFERNRERAVANGSRLLSDLEMSSTSDLPRTGSGMNNPVSLSNEGNEFTLDDPDEANKRD